MNGFTIAVVISQVNFLSHFVTLSYLICSNFFSITLNTMMKEVGEYKLHLFTGRYAMKCGRSQFLSHIIYIC